MVNKDLIQRLDDSGLVDKRDVLWWQLGFEGRRIFSVEEFEGNLKTISFEVRYDWGWRPITPKKEEFKVWTKDEVPILIRELEFNGLTLPFFISVKPLSHGGAAPGRVVGNQEAGFCKDVGVPLDVYLSPHIRGIAIDVTDRFLFWYPITFGRCDYNCYTTYGYTHESLDTPIILNPISHTKFYQNLIKGSWSHGRRAQKKPKIFDCEKEGFEIVPYFEFDPIKPHLMVYPIPLFEGKLDLPVLVKSRTSKPVPEVLGVGYYYAEERSEVYYWELDKQKQRIVRDTLKSGLETVVLSNSRQ